MDLEAFKQTLSAIGAIFSLLKQAKDLLPEGGKSEEIAKAIENAELKLKSAEAESAQAMGYEICRNHWPAGIMLSKDNMVWKCQDCGNEIDRNPKRKKPNYFSLNG